MAFILAILTFACSATGDAADPFDGLFVVEPLVKVQAEESKNNLPLQSEQTALLSMGDDPYRTAIIPSGSSQALILARQDAEKAISNLRSLEWISNYLYAPSPKFAKRTAKDALKILAFYPAAIVLTSGNVAVVAVAGLGVSLARFVLRVQNTETFGKHARQYEARVKGIVEELVQKGVLTEGQSTELLKSNNPHAVSDFLEKRFQIPRSGKERFREACGKILKLLP